MASVPLEWATSAGLSYTTSRLPPAGPMKHPPSTARIGDRVGTATANRLRKLPGGAGGTRDLDHGSGGRSRERHPAAYAAGSPVLLLCLLAAPAHAQPLEKDHAEKMARGTELFKKHVR